MALSRASVSVPRHSVRGALQCLRRFRPSSQECEEGSPCLRLLRLLRRSIVCTELSFAWPDGTPVFDRLDVAFGPGRTGLIGANGSGKSTLLRLIAGELRPTSGAVHVAGDVGYLPQRLPLDVGRTVAELLGIEPVRRALRDLERGDLSEAELAERYAVIGDDWDAEERARAELDRLGLARRPTARWHALGR